MWVYSDNIVCVCVCVFAPYESKRSVFPQQRKRPVVGRGGDPCLAWPTPCRWGTPVIQTLRSDSPRSWIPCLEDSEHRISLVATADDVRSMQTCNKTDGGMQMPKQKQRKCFFFFLSSFLSTLSTSGYLLFFSQCAGVWRSLAPSDVKPYKQISEHGHFWLPRT